MLMVSPVQVSNPWLLCRWQMSVIPTLCAQHPDRSLSLIPMVQRQKKAWQVRLPGCNILGEACNILGEAWQTVPPAQDS